ncbi:hypothetical protein ACFWF7_16615 [Nocardia sp. NPDC060256]|uniref:DUF7336 domain-containing protein n=1 Tax=unclassified Nocardia TaxID=2637762 RepID=UPI00364FFED8
MNEPYLLQHYYELPDGAEKLRIIGVYSSEANAKRAIERMVKLPGFSHRPGDFQIVRHSLNRDHWTRGFATA